MKVVHYSTFLSRSAGGLFYSVSGLAKAQFDSGLDVVVVGGADEHFEQDRGQWGRVALEVNDLAWGGYGLNPQAAGQLVRAKPDLIHVHGIWSAASLYARVFSRLGVPVVVSPRGMLDPWILARRPTVKRVHATLFERPALRRAHIHALNQSEYESVIRYMPGAAARTFVIPNGVDEALTPGTSDRSGVLYIGRLHAKKQVVELAKLWRSARLLQDLSLTIAGWGDADYEKELRSVVDGASNVRFVGPLYGEAKSRALNAARFSILPSLSEGLPMAVLEALQSGAVPIITDQCNLPELFEGRVAFQIRTDLSDVEAVVSAAARQPKTELERLGQAGIDFSQRYLWSSIAKTMSEQYQAVLERR